VSIYDGTCESTRTAVDATVLSPPPAPSVTGDNVCGSGTIPLTASGGLDGQYRWYDVPSGGVALTGEVDNIFITPTLTTTTSYFVSIDGGCESERIEVVATVNSVPDAPGATGASVCAGAPANLGASGSSDGNYRWYTTATGGLPITGEVNSVFIVASLSSNASYFVSVVSGDCESTRTEVTAMVIDCSENNPPEINATPLTTQIGSTISFDLLSIISDADGDLNPETLQITGEPQSGAQASIDENGNLLLDYSGISFSGIDRLTIRACDNSGSCTEEELTVDVIGDIFIYNAISPNGDGLNDIFLIQNINLLPVTRKNRVVLYNRWGDAVFEVSDYDNTSRVFKGLNDNGKALPSGTYFYKIEFASGLPIKSGYLVLKH
jgi:gliding motility-associated-like protein